MRFTPTLGGYAVFAPDAHGNERFYGRVFYHSKQRWLARERGPDPMAYAGRTRSIAAQRMVEAVKKRDRERLDSIAAHGLPSIAQLLGRHA